MPVKQDYSSPDAIDEQLQVHTGDYHGGFGPRSSWSGFLEAGYLDYPSGPNGSMKSCLHIKAKRQVHQTEYLALHPWNGYPYFFPLGKGGGTQCSHEYRNAYAFALNNFFTEVGVERPQVSGVMSTPDLNLAVYPTRELLLRAVSNLGQPEIDLPLFLYELKDLKGILKKVKSSWANRKLPPGRSIDTIGIKDLASSYLGYEFGLRPLVSDLKKVFELITQFERKFQRYLRRAKGLQSCHAFVDLDPVNTTSVDLHGSLKTVVSTSERRVRVTVRYRLHSNALDDHLGRISYAMQAVGARLSARTMWNAIPFSFMFDWFLNIDSLLNEIDGTHVDVIEVVDACITYKCVESKLLSCRPPYLEDAYQEAASQDLTVFKRLPIEPHILSGVLTEEGLVGKRLTLSAALLLANSDTIKRASVGLIDQLLRSSRSRDRAAKRAAKRYDAMVSAAVFSKKRRRYGKTSRYTGPDIN